jgi:hypothetical protein
MVLAVLVHRLGTAASCRAQFLNRTLPGGVLGDVDRAVRQRVDAGGPLRQLAVGGRVAVLQPATWPAVLAASLLVVGGRRPREGASAWAFSAAGLGTVAGAAVATAFGVLTFAAVLPGAVVPLGGRLRPRRRTVADEPSAEHLAGVVTGGPGEDGAADG